MSISCNMCDSPIDEGGHSSTLDSYCECYQNRGGACLAKKVHAQVTAGPHCGIQVSSGVLEDYA
jgi:hypothetical protein